MSMKTGLKRCISSIYKFVRTEMAMGVEGDNFSIIYYGAGLHVTIIMFYF